MAEISIEKIKKLPHSELLKLIEAVKADALKSDALKDKFDEYGVDLEEFKYVPICFIDLEVSARTDHGIIYLNNKLLESGNVSDISHYVVHEVTHFLQQTTGDGPTQGSTDDNYLDNKYEIEGFRTQTEFLADTQGEEVAEEYVDDVLDHHEVPKNERKERMESLLAVAKTSRLNVLRKIAAAPRIRSLSPRARLRPAVRPVEHIKPLGAGEFESHKGPSGIDLDRPSTKAVKEPTPTPVGTSVPDKPITSVKKEYSVRLDSDGKFTKENNPHLFDDSGNYSKNVDVSKLYKEIGDAKTAQRVEIRQRAIAERKANDAAKKVQRNIDRNQSISNFKGNVLSFFDKIKSNKLAIGGVGSLVGLAILSSYIFGNGSVPVASGNIEKEIISKIPKPTIEINGNKLRNSAQLLLSSLEANDDPEFKDVEFRLNGLITQLDAINSIKLDLSDSAQVTNFAKSVKKFDNSAIYTLNALFEINNDDDIIGQIINKFVNDLSLFVEQIHKTREIKSSI